MDKEAQDLLDRGLLSVEQITAIDAARGGMSRLEYMKRAIAYLEGGSGPAPEADDFFARAAASNREQSARLRELKAEQVEGARKAYGRK